MQSSPTAWLTDFLGTGQPFADGLRSLKLADDSLLATLDEVAAAAAPHLGVQLGPIRSNGLRTLTWARHATLQEVESALLLALAERECAVPERAADTGGVVAEARAAEEVELELPKPQSKLDAAEIMRRAVRRTFNRALHSAALGGTAELDHTLSELHKVMSHELAVLQDSGAFLTCHDLDDDPALDDLLTGAVLSRHALQRVGQRKLHDSLERLDDDKYRRGLIAFEVGHAVLNSSDHREPYACLPLDLSRVINCPDAHAGRKAPVGAQLSNSQLVAVRAASGSSQRARAFADKLDSGAIRVAVVRTFYCYALSADDTRVTKFIISSDGRTIITGYTLQLPTRSADKEHGQARGGRGGARGRGGRGGSGGWANKPAAQSRR